MKTFRSVKVTLPRTAVVGAIAAMAMLLLAAPVNAQSAADQYIPSPSPDGTQSTPAAASAAPGGSTATTGNPDAPASPAAEQKSGSSGGTDIPLTGYPLTPVVDLMLLLVVGGLVLRFLAPGLARRV